MKKHDADQSAKQPNANEPSPGHPHKDANGNIYLLNDILLDRQDMLQLFRMSPPHPAKLEKRRHHPLRGNQGKNLLPEKRGGRNYKTLHDQGEEAGEREEVRESSRHKLSQGTELLFRFC